MMTTGPFQVPVDTRPAGAVVVHQGKEVGVTPCLVTVTRSARLFELRREGYHAEVVDVGTLRNPWVDGNVVTLGLGVVVDVILGSNRNPDTGPVLIQLMRDDGPERGGWVRARPLPEPVAWPPENGFGQFVGAALEWAAHR